MTEKHKSKQEVIEAIESFYNDKKLPVAKTREGLKALKTRINGLLADLHAEHPDPEHGQEDEGDDTGAEHEDTGEGDENGGDEKSAA